MAVSPILAVGEPTAVPSGTSETDPALHLRTQFLRRVAHDIASPTGVTLTVLEELANAERPRPELVAMARRSLRRLMRLSEHLALVAELESGTLEPEPSVVDMRTLVKQGLDDAVAIDGRKDVVAACDLPSQPLVAFGDQRLLQVVVREVIGNALKLASSRVEVSLKQDGERVVLRVDDDGPGFPEEARATLGRRFVRRSSARGLGLSLSMATEILDGHGGDLAIDTSALPPGRRGTTGSAVIVTLPMRDAAAAR
ncbi:MAG TPA: HAMP domain-containing sensor histidine kinase [Labilithrix sp.]|jgi:two-component system sensor histidine kinase KdpD